MTIKLSEAIRQGAKLRPQTTNGEYYQDGCSCAMGAAYEAIGGKYGDWDEDVWEGLKKSFGFDITTTAWEIKAKNDDEKMTREQIADWLESKGK